MIHKKHHWMPAHQIALYEGLCEEFEFEKITDIGRFLGINNPYHGARLIFEAQKQNIYLKKLLEERKKARIKIAYLTEKIDVIKQISNNIIEAEEKLKEAYDLLKLIPPEETEEE